MPKKSISPEQYRLLQCPAARRNTRQPVALPSSKELFDYIVKVLVAKKLMTYDDADLFRDNLPNRGLFLPILPRFAELDLNYLVSLIKVDRKKGESPLDPKYFTDIVEAPKGPYLILGIKDGTESDMESSAFEANILKKHRSPYTVLEGIIHSIVFPEVFKRSNMYLRGSRFGPELVPSLYLLKNKKGKLLNGKPILAALHNIPGRPMWDTPSCSSRKAIKGVRVLDV